MTPITPSTHPAASSTTHAPLHALLTGSAFAPLPQTGWIKATGDDRVRWLNGMTTNSIQQLQPGQGNYNFLLSAQGRIQGDAYAFALADHILLETDRAHLPALVELLDRFIIMDDVLLEDVSARRHGILCAGPTAAATLQSLGIEAAALDSLALRSLPWRGAEIILLSAYSLLVPRFELWTEDAATAQALTEALTAAGAAPVDADALDQVRLLEGTPRYGIDIRDRELPQETEQTRALHFAKGCYLGQEIVERIRSRGNVHRTFHAFLLTGEFPFAGAALETDGKPVGELTSALTIPFPDGPVQLALGYIRREALDRGLPLHYPGGEAAPVSVPYRDALTPPGIS
ncbi:MAG TPA: folate-binding protein [Granulicella sp.]|nr:folate-binding protein [Granulicella sp.]